MVGFIAPGWKLDEQGRLRRETKPHMGRRLPGYDYRRPGRYVVTVVLEDRRSAALGELTIRRKPSARADGGRTDSWPRQGGDEGWLSVAEARKLSLAPDEVEAKIVFSKLGRAISAHFRRMGEFSRGLRPVYCAIMPDHLHLLVEVVSELARPLGNAIGGFKTGCEKIYAKLGGAGRLFAEGFVDEIVLRAGQLSQEFDYLLDNPRRSAITFCFRGLRFIRFRFRGGISLMRATRGEGF